MKGAIAAGHPSSAHAGANVLENGGNAVDALLAALFAAFVVEGPLTGPAGGGFLLVHEPHGETTLFDCFFSVPSARLGAIDEVVVDFEDAGTQLFHVGPGSVAVPGLVAGLEVLHRRFASVPWADLVSPAIELARDGFARDEPRAFLHRILVPILLHDEGGRRVYGDPERVVTDDLVETLVAIRDDGAAAVAGLLPEYAADLVAHDVRALEPLEARISGHEVFTTPPPSRGGGVVLRILERLERLERSGDSSPGDRADALRHGYESAPVGRLTGTTHVSVMDESGLAAAASSTLGSGSGVFRAGAQLNNMLGEGDVIGPGPHVPGERLASMLTPTLVLEEEEPRLVLGSAGSVRLSGAIAQVAWDVVGRGMPLADAIDAPRMHVDGATVHLEGGWPDAAAEGLGADWNVVRWSGRNLFFGGVQAVARSADGRFEAAGDPRRGGFGRVVA
jgi:gamma-glutamyltranspeptidase/glutathione hydrolase